MCGHLCAVPDRQRRGTLKGFLLGCGVGVAIGGIVAAGVAWSLWQQDRTDAQTLALSESVPDQASRAIASQIVAPHPPREAIEKLTASDVDRFAERGGMKLIVSGEDPHFSNWEGTDGLFIRCIWLPDSPNRQIKSILICRTSVDHGAEGQAPVLEAWRELCPSMGPRFQALFGNTYKTYSALHWVGKSPYTYGVGANNKAFVDRIGEQSEIETRRKWALVTASIQINWFRILEGSQEALVERLGKVPLPEARDIVRDEMQRLGNMFEHITIDVGLEIEDYTASLGSQWPDGVPDFLPVKARLELHQIASSIGTTARIAQFNAQRGAGTLFKPYDHMYMAFAAHGNAVREAWGPYARLAGFDEWGNLPSKQAKMIEEISFHGLAAVMNATTTKNPPE